MVINTTSSVMQPLSAKVNDRTCKDTAIVDGKGDSIEKKPDFMEMRQVVDSWHNAYNVTQEPVSLAFEVSSMVGGFILGVAALGAVPGTPVGLIGGIVLGAAVAMAKNTHDVRRTKKAKKEVEENRELVAKYEKILNEEEAKQIKIQQEQAQIAAQEEAKRQEELRKQKELKEAEERKKQEEIKKQQEVFENSLEEDVQKFKEKNDILFETDIISSTGWNMRACESYYNIGKADIIDVNKDGKANISEHFAGTLRSEEIYKEPALTYSYDSLQKLARSIPKGILISEDVKGGIFVEKTGVNLGATGFQRDYELHEDERSLDLMAKNLMPDMVGVKGAIDTVNQKFLIYKPKAVDSYSI